MTTHIMVDLETLGIDHDSPIIAIGATDGTNSFYGKISLADVKGSISPGVMLWWLGQDKEAIQENFFTPSTHGDFSSLLSDFTVWLRNVIDAAQEDYRIYGNGVDFDLVMLTHQYRELNWVLPWNFRKQMCYRALKNQFHYIQADDLGGIKHSALADAQYQHAHLIKILNHIDNMESYFNEPPLK